MALMILNSPASSGSGLGLPQFGVIQSGALSLPTGCREDEPWTGSRVPVMVITSGSSAAAESGKRRIISRNKCLMWSSCRSSDFAI